MPRIKQPAATEPTAGSPRLYYLDWLRVIAIFGVFVFHALHPFDTIGWHIKNAEQSDIITLIAFGLFASWGIAMFFLISGASSLLAMKHRSQMQYLKERVIRLFIPFLAGSALFSVLQLWFQFRHEGRYDGSLLGFVPVFLETQNYGRAMFTPKVFGIVGIHLWFLGFLFAFSVLATPVMHWFKSGGSQRFVQFGVSLAEHRGGLVLFAIPLVLVRWILQPFTTGEHDWADFAYLFGVFVLGAFLFSDKRLIAAVRRDWAWLTAAGAVGLGVIVGAYVAGVGEEWVESPGEFGFYLAWGGLSVAGWCFSVALVSFAMRFLNRTNGLLSYSTEIILPFYLLHQPVIIAISFYVVQWDLNLYIKALIVLTSSFAVTMAIIEVIVRPLPPLRFVFGMRPTRLAH